MPDTQSHDHRDDTAHVFWGEIAPCDHLVQIYENDGALLDALELFAASGMMGGEAVVVIATPTHREELRGRILRLGIDLNAAENDDRYIALTAKEALSEFMVDGWPDDVLFRNFVMRVLTRARSGGRRVRAFGEMVALLWSQGYNGATVRLEYLWEHMCREESFSLFCAYPKAGFTRDAAESVREIRAAHNRVVANTGY